jgi:hypothetical protein
LAARARWLPSELAIGIVLVLVAAIAALVLVFSLVRVVVT